MKKKYFCKKQSLLLMLVAICYSGLLAQPSYRWGHTINEQPPYGGIGGVSYGEGITIDSQGNILTTGFSYGSFDFDPSPTGQAITNGDNSANVYIQKLDNEGNYLWHRYYGDESATAFGESLTTDADSNIYIVGTFSGTLFFGNNVSISSNGHTDVYVLKLDSNGNAIWARNFGLSGYDEGGEIFYNKDTDELYFSGTYSTIQTPSSVTDDTFLYKISPTTGNDIWFRTYGSVHHEEGNGITGDDLGNVYMTGTYFKKLDYRDFSSGNTVANLLSTGSTNRNAFVLKVNSNGNVVWAKGFNKQPNVQPGERIEGNVITIDENRNVYIAGTFKATVDFDPNATNFIASNQGLKDIYIVSLKASGEFRWFQRVEGGNTAAYDRVETITVDNQNGVLTGGTTSSGGLFISRHATANGNIHWIHKGGSGDVGSIVTGNCNQVYATGGLFSNTNDFDPDINTTLSLPLIGHTNAFNIAWGANTPPVLDPAFTYEVCMTTLKVAGVNQVAGANPNSDWHLIEYFPGTSTEIVRESIYWWQQPAPYLYHTNPIVFNYQLQPRRYYYVKHGVYLNECAPWKEARKYGITTNNIPCPRGKIAELSIQKTIQKQLPNLESVKLFPNPVNNMLNIEFGTSKIMSYTILDFSGKRVMEKEYLNGAVDVSGLKSGNYMLQIKTANGVYVKRFVKE
ncbi:T9SS type A sorting domain-containing protein [Aquimarina sp. TRL1]|uniref:SBBP repeat-containing protein n=1 Tax=Aquimarina sp. (strain TRL1) TaxID=2736252 RepID=UPI0015895E07|nr:SBBP repeat-containing protein [Aquimarina sp. TRL1]QKX03788.1 T9SS type A sorting domain-containing protein [Aquimarina sp. TRL1]